MIHREFVLLAILSVAAIVGFLFTRSLAAQIRDLRTADAMRWFDLGQGELQVGELTLAVEHLRRATNMDPADASYALSLARALSLDGRDPESMQVLLGLRDAQPDDPATNLELARLEARADRADEAVRYYQAALAALWVPAEADQRRQTRVELIQYLLARRNRGRALSELLVLNADLPEDVDAQVSAGRMFLEAGDAGRAASRFAQVLLQNPDQGEALAGAGQAAFELGDYERALRYLSAAPAGGAGVADTKAVVEFIMSRDPLAPRIGSAERSRRLAASAAEFLILLDSCPLDRPDDGTPAFAGLRALREEVAALVPPTGPGRKRVREVATRDSAEDGLLVLIRAARARTEAKCVPQTPIDRAVLLIAERHALAGGA